MTTDPTPWQLEARRQRGAATTMTDTNAFAPIRPGHNDWCDGSGSSAGSACCRAVTEGGTNAFALATDPDAILDARRDSFACAACGSPDPARLYDGGCSDCRAYVIAYNVMGPTELAAIETAVGMLREGVRLIGVQGVTHVPPMWRVRMWVWE